MTDEPHQQSFFGCFLIRAGTIAQPPSCHIEQNEGPATVFRFNAMGPDQYSYFMGRIEIWTAHPSRIHFFAAGVRSLVTAR
jgi:hypothetical protein